MAEQTITLPADHPKHSPKSERRAWVRLPCHRRISCRPIAGQTIGDTGWLGRVLDISLGGIGLMLRHRVEQETDLVIELATKAGELRSLPAQVVRITQERDGCWIVGCTFASLLTQ